MPQSFQYIIVTCSYNFLNTFNNILYTKKSRYVYKPIIKKENNLIPTCYNMKPKYIFYPQENNYLTKTTENTSPHLSLSNTNPETLVSQSFRFNSYSRPPLVSRLKRIYLVNHGAKGNVPSRYYYLKYMSGGKLNRNIKQGSKVSVLKQQRYKTVRNHAGALKQSKLFILTGCPTPRPGRCRRG